ncbi:MAG: hypothetical protein Q8P54_01805 [bacterium]|nr:hypothetical protein [bacterium]
MKKIIIIFSLIFALIVIVYFIYQFATRQNQPVYKILSNKGGVQTAVFDNDNNFTYLDKEGALYKYSYQENSVKRLGTYINKSHLSENAKFIREITDENKTNIYSTQDKKIVKKIDALVFGWQTGSEYLYVKIPDNVRLGNIEVEDFTTAGNLISSKAESGSEKKLSKIVATQIYSITNTDFAIMSIDKSIDSSGLPSSLFKYNLKTNNQAEISNNINIYQSHSIGSFILFKDSPDDRASVRYIDKNGEVKNTNLSANINNTATLDEENFLTIIRDKKGKNIIVKYNLQSQKTKSLFELKEDIENPTNLFYKNDKIIIANGAGIWLLELGEIIK